MVAKQIVEINNMTGFILTKYFYTRFYKNGVVFLTNPLLANYTRRNAVPTRKQERKPRKEADTKKKKWKKYGGESRAPLKAVEQRAVEKKTKISGDPLRQN